MSDFGSTIGLSLKQLAERDVANADATHIYRLGSPDACQPNVILHALLPLWKLCYDQAPSRVAADRTHYANAAMYAWLDRWFEGTVPRPESVVVPEPMVPEDPPVRTYKKLSL